jgi:hypothetical protein
VSVGDIDGDGDPDVIVANKNQPNIVWVNNGLGTFEENQQSLGDFDSRGVTLGDIDGDLDLDAIVVNVAGQLNRVWINNSCAPLHPENCTNNFDDDGDALIDCLDPDCANDPACAPDPCSGGVGSPCDDGDPCTVDDSCDGAGNCVGTPINCDDGDPCTLDVCNPQTGICEHTPIPGCSPENCTNQVDDDGDSLIDCLDPDCANDPACAPDPCSGGVGSPCDDGDPCTVDDSCDEAGVCIGIYSDTDADGVCDTFDICPGSDDTIDTDGDGVPDGCDLCPGGDDSIDTDVDGVADACDCDPIDGTTYPGATEICDDGIDNDCDTLIDCDDSDCTTHPFCVDVTPCDLAADCDDLDPCTTDECVGGFCVNTPIPGCDSSEICDNGIDDDGNSLTDCDDPACAADPACQGSCTVTNIAVGCDPANGPDSYLISFDVINETAFEVSHAIVLGTVPGLPGSTVSPTITSFNPPLAPGSSGTVLLSLTGGSPFLTVCFPVGLMAIDDSTGNLFECCATEVCAELPQCDSCMHISEEGGEWDANTFGYTFTVTNLPGTPPVIAEYAYLMPVTPGITIDNNWFELGQVTDEAAVALSVNISGGSPNQDVCFLLTIHDATLGECCGFVHCLTLPPFLLPPEVPFMRGDANSDGVFDVSDVITTFDYIFQGEYVPCDQALDSNDDDLIDIGDAVYSLMALFAGGAEPAPPGARCGLDETPGTLTCELFPPCD